MTAMQYDLREASKKSTFNGQAVTCKIVAESMEQAFTTFKRIFPSAGDPQCTGQRPAMMIGGAA